VIGKRLAAPCRGAKFPTMSLSTQIDDDIKTAMRAKEADKLSLLRMLKSAVKNAAIEKGGAEAVLDDSEVITVIRKLTKQREDSVESFVKGDRPELAAKERAEIAVLATYLPKPLSPEEITAIIEAAIAEIGSNEKAKMGQIMKAASTMAAGRVDGKTLSAALQKLLV